MTLGHLPSTALQARPSLTVQQPSVVTHEFRYRAPQATEVYLVWGIDGWGPVSLEDRPPGTEIRDSVMHSPMQLEGDAFVARVRVPRGAAVRYGFLVTGRQDGTVTALWEGNDAYVIQRVGDGGPTTVDTQLPLEEQHLRPSLRGMILILAVDAAVAAAVLAAVRRRHRPRVGHSRREDGGPPDARTTILDSLFLGMLVLLSLVLYVAQLGFYSDDWAYLGNIDLSPERTVTGFFRHVYGPQLWIRPTYSLYLSFQFLFFGLDPLGYHVMNSGVLVAIAVLFYLCLREAGLPRLLALAIPAVYALLPNYATVRFWLASFHVSLSTVFYFLSLYSEFRAVRAAGRRLWWWKGLSMFSIAVSALSYETVLPLFFLNPLLVWWRSRRREPAALPRNQEWLRTNLVAQYTTSLLVLIPVLIFKALNATRLDVSDNYLVHLAHILRRALSFNYGRAGYGLNLWQALDTQFASFLTDVPRSVAAILGDDPGLALVSGSALTAIVVLAYLYRAAVAEGPDGALLGRKALGWMMVGGMVVFALGYAIFLTTSQVQFSTTGIANRTASGAAIGTALVVVAALAWCCTFMPRRRVAALVFSLVIAWLCAAGFLINNALARFWAVAYDREEAILSEIRREIPELDSGSVVILDGVCPYVGPAIVFESNWDLQGALFTMYGDPTLRADIAGRSLRVTDEGLTTSLYGWTWRYPYDRLVVYDATTKRSHRLTDAGAARRYFTSAAERRPVCPSGHEGHGVPVFEAARWSAAARASVL